MGAKTVDTDNIKENQKVITIIIPIYKPDYKFKQLLEKYNKQTIVKKCHLAIIDSGNSHEYDSLINEVGGQHIFIPPNSFDHGGTRQLGVNINFNADIVVFLTQDAVFVSDDTLETLVTYLKQSKAAAVYGRQIPYEDADVFSAFSRKLNYGDKLYLYSLSDKDQHGIKVAFLSNSFAAYKVKLLKSIGGFPEKVIFGEDMYVAAKLLLAGEKIGYCPHARVYHSHNYTGVQYFKRAFDMGVFHEEESWLLKIFGTVEGEGIRFVLKEFRAVCLSSPIRVFKWLFYNSCKLIGYRLGRNYKKLPIVLVNKFTMNHSYWK